MRGHRIRVNRLNHGAEFACLSREAAPTVVKVSEEIPESRKRKQKLNDDYGNKKLKPFPLLLLLTEPESE